MSVNARPGPDSDSVGAAKAELRRELIRRLGTLGPGERAAGSAAACAMLASLDLFANAQTVMLYFPLRSELDVSPLARAGKRVCVPRVDWESGAMTPALVGDWDRGGVAGKRGVRQPRPELPAVDPTELDAVVVPGLGFDVNRNRLGRGGGFYDRFLARALPRAAKVGIGFDVQIVEAIPIGPDDVRLDAVVTDCRVIR